MRPEAQDHNLKESPALSSTVQYSKPICKQHTVSYCTGAHVLHMPHCTVASLQPCNHFRNDGQALPRIQMSYVHNYSMTHVGILGNDCPWFGNDVYI